MRGERWFEWLKEESADDRDGLPESEELAADALADRSRSGGYGMSEDDLLEGWALAAPDDIVTDMPTGFACGRRSRADGVPDIRPMNIF